MNQELYRVHRACDVTRTQQANGQPADLLHVLQGAAGERHSRHLESLTSDQECDFADRRTFT